jgi:hypothetical protein
VTGVRLAWLVVDGRPTPAFLAGAALILTAVWLAARAERRRGFDSTAQA